MAVLQARVRVCVIRIIRRRRGRGGGLEIGRKGTRQKGWKKGKKDLYGILNCEKGPARFMYVGCGGEFVLNEFVNCVNCELRIRV